MRERIVTTSALSQGFDPILTELGEIFPSDGFTSTIRSFFFLDSHKIFVVHE